MSDSAEWSDEPIDEGAVDPQQAANADEPAVPPYTPPDRLPPPALTPQSFPPTVLLLGVGTAIVLGGALFAASHLIYVYILYNAMIGIGIGTMIARAPERGRFTNLPILFTVSAVCSVLAYVVYHVSWHQWVLAKNPGMQIGFLDFVWLQAQVMPFIGGMQLGAVGNIAVWLVEIGITLYYAWQRVHAAAQIAAVSAVPSEVLEFVSFLFWQHADDDHIRAELSKRGWMMPDDQTRAIRAFRTAQQM